MQHANNILNYKSAANDDPSQDRADLTVTTEHRMIE